MTANRKASLKKHELLKVIYPPFLKQTPAHTQR